MTKAKSFGPCFTHSTTSDLLILIYFLLIPYKEFKVQHDDLRYILTITNSFIRKYFIVFYWSI